MSRETVRAGGASCNASPIGQRMFLSVVAAAVGVATVPAATHSAGVPACDGSLLWLSIGEPAPAVSGEHPATFDLRNRGPRACALVGYPGVRLLDRRGVLPFKYQWGGPYVFQKEAPRRVIVRPGGRASFVVAQYRCDAGPLRGARSIQVYAPGDTRARRLRLPKHQFTYCRAARGPSRLDPGNRIYIGPVRAPLR